MREARSDDPHRMVWEQGGTGCMVLLGLPFLVAGLIIAPLPLLGEPGLSEGIPPALLLTVPFGLIFAAVGALLILVRSQLVVERQEGAVSRSWRLLVPLRGTDRPLEDFDRVALRREEHEVGGHPNIVYAVQLEGRGDSLAAAQESDYETARLRAERLARFLQLPLHDHAQGATVVRGPDHLDESLRERAARTGESVKVPPMPQGCRIAGFERNGDLVLSLPHRPLGLRGTWGVVVFIALWVAPASVLLWTWALRADRSRRALAILGPLWVLCVLVPLACMAWGLLKHLSTRETLRVSTEGLQLEQSWLAGTRKHCIPADELEELRGDQECLTARSDRQSFDFGFGLTDEEREWLGAALRAVLVHP